MVMIIYVAEIGLEYSNIWARLLNSQALLEGTGLCLYTINQTTLVSKLPSVECQY